jgi:uncharacterized protein YaiE (UPF0345 family)
MDPNKKAVTATIGTMMGLILLFLAPSTCRAQEKTPLSGQYPFGTDSASLTAVSGSVTTNQPTADDSAVPSPGQAGKTAQDDAWHLSVAPYLWFPGIHGTVGANGRTVSIHASVGDLLSNFRFGLMGAVEARRKRLLLPLDMVWVRIGDDKALPFSNLMATTAEMKGSQFILSPKVGFRLLDQGKFKVDALTGFRYWHFGENLEFPPSNRNLDLSASQNWVDPVVGGRIAMTLSPKLSVNILGDVGGWGAKAQLEYQVTGLLGYRIKPNWSLAAGYRYLYVDYRSGGSIVNIAMSGALLGVTVNLK